MARPGKILVAYDGSPHSKDALRWALYFKRLLGSSIMAVKVFEPFNYSENRDDIDTGGIGPELLASQAEKAHAGDVKMLAEIKHEAANQNAVIETELVTGNAAKGILECAKQYRADMIIAGTRGHGALEELLIGSVTGKLVSLAHVPVMVVKNYRAASSDGLKKILVAYDGSLHSREALNWAMDLAAGSDAQILAVKVFEPLPLTVMYTMPEAGIASRLAEKLLELQDADARLMEGVKEIGRARKMEISTEILHGEAANSILGCAKQRHADVIIAGTRGHGTLEGLLVGSVTRRLVSVSPVPVLVVKD